MRKLLLLIGLLVMAGCGHDAGPSSPAAAKATATSTPDPLAAYSDGVRKYYVGAQLDAADDPDADAEVRYFQPPMPAETAVGDAITLTGSNIGVRLRVTVGGVRTVRAGGRRYTAVDVRLKNTGITVYQGVLESAVLTRAGGRTSGVAKASAACSNGFDDDFYLDVGRSRRGCLLFAAGGKPERLQLALETVPAAAGGIWDLGG
jgi:hypothetical protein